MVPVVHRAKPLKISLFTPSHDTSFLPQVWDSIKSQSHSDFEWTVLLNNGASNYENPDPRVQVLRDTRGIPNVGYLKRVACELSHGDILMEQDHDDILLPGALDQCSKAFQDPSTGFAYSNTVNHDIRNNTPISWDSRYGWTYRKFQHEGGDYVEAVSAEPFPQSISRIWFAPNHFRAWRTDTYWKVGGHNATMKITDDHDLMCRTYLTANMVHVDQPLYLYRVHGGNTWLKNQDDITRTMWECHDKYIEPMMLKWAKDRGLRCIDICGGVNPTDGYESVDIANADVTANLDERWPFDDNSVGVIRAHDAIEHLRSHVHTMNEAYRVLAHGGLFDILVPSSDGQGGFCDPGHVSFWNYRSFRYYTEGAYKKFVPDFKGRYQVLKLRDIRMWDDLPYISAHLIAVKQEKPRFYGDLLI